MRRSEMSTTVPAAASAQCPLKTPRPLNLPQRSGELNRGSETLKAGFGLAATQAPVVNGPKGNDNRLPLCDRGVTFLKTAPKVS